MAKFARRRSRPVSFLVAICSKALPAIGDQYVFDSFHWDQTIITYLHFQYRRIGPWCGLDVPREGWISPPDPYISVTLAQKVGLQSTSYLWGKRRNLMPISLTSIFMSSSFGYIPSWRLTGRLRCRSLPQVSFCRPTMPFPFSQMWTHPCIFIIVIVAYDEPLLALLIMKLPN